MKKTFLLTHDRHKPARVVELTKSEIRKYMKRERRRVLPEGMDFLAFDCKFGFGEETPSVVHESEFNKCIDQAVAQGCQSVYVEIIGKPCVRQKRVVESESSAIDEVDAESVGE